MWCGLASHGMASLTIYGHISTLKSKRILGWTLFPIELLSQFISCHSHTYTVIMSLWLIVTHNMCTANCIILFISTRYSYMQDIASHRENNYSPAALEIALFIAPYTSSCIGRVRMVCTHTKEMDTKRKCHN